MSEVAQYDESIEAAVRREAIRRKRMLTGYLALLVVSMAIGAFAVLRAPAEVTVVAEKVEPLVRDRVHASVAEGVTRDVVTRSERQIDEKISSTFNTTVKPRLDEVAGTSSSLRTSLDAINGQVAGIESTMLANSRFIETARPQLAQIASLEATINETTRSMSETYAKRSEVQERVETARTALQTETQAIIARERAALRTELRTMLAEQDSRNRAAILREVREEIRGNLKSVQEQIDKLENRIERLEGRPVDRERKPPG